MNIEYDDLNELEESLKGCGLCPIMVKSRIEVLGEKYNSPVTFKGNPHAAFMFVGQSPGRKLERMDKEKLNITMQPFQFGSGEVLSRVLEEAGYEEKEVYVTNIVKCNTPENNIFENKDVSRCVTLWLENEIRLVKPKCIILMGRIANDWFNMYINKDVIKGIKVFKVNHPAYISYRPDEYDNYLRSLTQIRETMVGDEHENVMESSTVNNN